MTFPSPGMLENNVAKAVLKNVAKAVLKLDNLLIARINALLTFTDYYRERWDREPDEKLLKTIANKMVWNLWQIDDLKYTVPFGKTYIEHM